MEKVPNYNEIQKNPKTQNKNDNKKQIKIILKTKQNKKRGGIASFPIFRLCNCINKARGGEGYWL